MSESPQEEIAELLARMRRCIERGQWTFWTPAHVSLRDLGIYPEEVVLIIRELTVATCGYYKTAPSTSVPDQTAYMFRPLVMLRPHRPMRIFLKIVLDDDSGLIIQSFKPDSRFAHGDTP